MRKRLIFISLCVVFQTIGTISIQYKHANDKYY